MKEMRCQDVMGIAYNEVSPLIEARCDLELGHEGMHSHKFRIDNRIGVLSWDKMKME